METNTVSQESINKIMELCRYLRADMGGMFVQDMAAFLGKLPTQLVEEAEKVPQTEQQDYFDIITLLRRDSDQVHLGMNAAITICIEEFIHYVQNVDKASSNEDAGSLSLIDTDDIEVTIVVEGLAGRVSSKLADTMNDAYLRIKQLVPSVQQATQLPCHPRALIQAMIDSMATLSLTTAQKVILARLFTPLIDAKRLEEIIQQSLNDANIPAYDKRIKNLDHSADQSIPTVAEQLDQQYMNMSGVMPALNSPAGTQQVPTIGNTAPTNQFNTNNTPNQGATSFAGAGGGFSGTGNIPASGGHTQQGSTTDLTSPTGAMPGVSYYHNSETVGSSTAQMAAQQDATLAEYADSTATPMFSNASELLQQLGHLKALRKQMAKMPVTPAPKNPMVTEQTLATQALDGLLSDIQLEQPTTSVRHDTRVQSVGEIRNEIRNRLQSDDETVQTIQDKDSDVINLVSLMFDYILDNPNLPTAMKALLARLQIPMLRVALLTPSFFAESNHPARQLLDKLSKAGISWDKASDKDAYYDKLESIVFRVLKEFRDDVSIFDTLLDELNEFLADQEKLAERIGSRTKTTEEKRAQTEISKNFVQKQLNERLIGKKLPFAVVKILQNGWWHVLYHTLIRHGRESAQWKNALKVVDALVWSVIPPVTERAQWLQQVNKIQLKLIDNLQKGLTQVNFDPLQKSQLIQEIEKIHADVIKERQIQQVDVALETTQTTEEALTNALKPGEKIELPNSAASETDDAISTSSAESKPAAIKLPNDKIKRPDVDATVNQPIDPAYIDIVKNIASGTWIEFKADTDSPERCKLVAKIRALDKLVFTNRRGIKVAEIGQSKLARQLSSGQARIIEEDAHIVETALNSVMSDLEKLESKRPDETAPA